MGSLASGPIWGITVVVLCLAIVFISAWRFERQERRDRRRNR